MTDNISLNRQTRLDRLFERLLQAYRQTLLDAIAIEPVGPTRFLRAHVSVMVQIARRQTRAIALASKLLRFERYQAIWFEFLAEACATLTEDQNRQRLVGPTALEESHWAHTSGDVTLVPTAIVDTIPTQCQLISRRANAIQIPTAIEKPKAAPATHEPHRTC